VVFVMHSLWGPIQARGDRTACQPLGSATVAYARVLHAGDEAVSHFTKSHHNTGSSVDWCVRIYVSNIRVLRVLGDPWDGDDAPKGKDRGRKKNNVPSARKGRCLHMPERTACYYDVCGC
jgi:hypothetical protein